FWERFAPIRWAGSARADGSETMRVDVGGLTDRLGVGSYVVHRADLHAALSEGLEHVTLGKRCVGIELRDRSVRARFDDGSDDEAELLVGADGLRSVVRTALWGDRPPRYSGETCYRAVAHFVHPEPEMLREV